MRRYHAGDWRGFWTTFVPSDDGVAKVSERRVRTHLEVNEARDAVLHTNTYHDDTGGGEDTSQCYGTYERGSPLRSKHLPRAFLFGPGLLPGTSSFASELGLRWDDAFGGVPGGRVRAVAVHAPGAGDVAELEKLVIIREIDGDEDAYRGPRTNRADADADAVQGSAGHTSADGRRRGDAAGTARAASTSEATSRRPGRPGGRTREPRSDGSAPARPRRRRSSRRARRASARSPTTSRSSSTAASACLLRGAGGLVPPPRSSSNGRRRARRIASSRGWTRRSTARPRGRGSTRSSPRTW